MSRESRELTHTGEQTVGIQAKAADEELPARGVPGLSPLRDGRPRAR